MAEQTVMPGSAYLQLVGGVAMSHPEEQVWEAMRRGFAIQQQSRYLAPGTVGQRDGQLRRFAAWTNEYPWQWRAQDVEEWTAAAASERRLARSTVRGVHFTLRLFMEYLIDGRYGWAAECEKRFGTHPVQIRWAKALPGGSPRRRTVLTVFDWAVENVEEYLADIRPLYDFEGLAAMWPTERGGTTADANIGKMFANLRDEAGLPGELGPHCLRHSYVTHLIEDGFEPLFVQQQVGHAWASTTAIYTSVGSDFKNQALRSILDRRLGQPKKKEEG